MPQCVTIRKRNVFRIDGKASKAAWLTRFLPIMDR